MIQQGPTRIRPMVTLCLESDLELDTVDDVLAEISTIGGGGFTTTIIISHELRSNAETLGKIDRDTQTVHQMGGLGDVHRQIKAPFTKVDYCSWKLRGQLSDVMGDV